MVQNHPHTLFGGSRKRYEKVGTRAECYKTHTYVHTYMAASAPFSEEKRQKEQLIEVMPPPTHLLRNCIEI